MGPRFCQSVNGLFGMYLILVTCICSASDREDFNPGDHTNPPHLLHKEYNDALATTGVTNHPGDKQDSIHQDERCRCTCTKLILPNNTTISSQIYIGKVTKAKDCSCPKIVLPKILGGHHGLDQDELDLHACPWCKCVYQRRNLFVMYVVVTMIISVIGFFMVYVILVELILPRIGRLPSYKQQTNDEINMDEMNEERPDDAGLGRFGTSTMNNGFGSRLINFITIKQSKWQSNLDQQRRNIYDEHTMLN